MFLTEWMWIDVFVCLRSSHQSKCTCTCPATFGSADAFQ